MRGAFGQPPTASSCGKLLMTRKVRVSFVGIASALSLAVGATAGCGDYPVASLKSNGVGTAGTSASGGGSAGNSAAGTAGTSVIPAGPAPLPCEVLGNAGHECVSAHSTVRVIVKGYTGPLYQVDSGSGTLDIGNLIIIFGMLELLAADDLAVSHARAPFLVPDRFGVVEGDQDAFEPIRDLH